MATRAAAPMPRALPLAPWRYTQSATTLRITDVRPAAAEDRVEDLEQAALQFSASGPAVTRKVERAMASVEKRWPDARRGVGIVQGVFRAQSRDHA
jgi:hypothetical protein